ncbi:hypothetical protein AVEN_225939-1 [Araneus ventricosus]|uniref:Uncharacterized protein n=1 Tax=Araneus ventricosus TaxID=182803 RepID=A0A4Y2GNL8_ARAVE|nr:hypothetical protein AVEN_225939-1 [Araneus ventricosus]
MIIFLKNFLICHSSSVLKRVANDVTTSNRIENVSDDLAPKLVSLRNESGDADPQKEPQDSSPNESYLVKVSDSKFGLGLPVRIRTATRVNDMGFLWVRGRRR